MTIRIETDKYTLGDSMMGLCVKWRTQFGQHVFYIDEDKVKIVIDFIQDIKALMCLDTTEAINEYIDNLIA